MPPSCCLCSHLQASLDSLGCFWSHLLQISALGTSTLLRWVHACKSFHSVALWARSRSSNAVHIYYISYYIGRKDCVYLRHVFPYLNTSYCIYLLIHRTNIWINSYFIDEIRSLIHTSFLCSFVPSYLRVFIHFFHLETSITSEHAPHNNRRKGTQINWQTSRKRQTITVMVQYISPWPHDTQWHPTWHPTRHWNCLSFLCLKKGPFLKYIHRYLHKHMHYFYCICGII